jgi:hypothetical protein
MDEPGAWQCPNGCDEILSVYVAEVGVYFGCAECLWMSERMSPDSQESAASSEA